VFCGAAEKRERVENVRVYDINKMP